MAWKNLWRRKVRSLLTILGSAVGVAAIVAMTTFADGLVDAFSEISSTAEADITVSQADAMILLMSAVDDSIGRELAAIRGVDAVVGTAAGVVQVQGVPYFLVLGEDPRGFLISHYRIVAGEPIRGRDEIMLGVLTARNHDKLVGDKFGIGDRRYTVVGIYETGAAFEDGGAVIALSDAVLAFDRRGQVNYYSLRLRDPSFAESVRAEIAERWPELTTMGSASTSVQAEGLQMYRSLGWFLGVFAALIGGLGVTNTVLMSVLERTRDIGVLRALGWRRRRIVGMILAEALMLSTIGGACGVVLGLGLVRAVQLLPATESLLAGDISPATTAQGMAAAICLGLGAGIYPALRAARMQPIDAMRVEGAAEGRAVRIGVGVLRNLLRRPLRTLVTVVGLGLGVGFIVALIAVVDGFSALFSQLGTAGGVDLMVEQANASDAAFSAIDERIAAEIEMRPDVESVSRLVLGVTSAPGAAYFIVFGLDAREDYIRHFNVVDGRSILRDNEVMLGRQVAVSLKRTVDDRITIAGRSYRVVGIFENGTAFEDSSGVLALREAQRIFHKVGQSSFLGLRVVDSNRADEIAATIEYEFPEVMVARVVDFTERMNDMRVTNAALDAVIAVTTVVGGLVMTNAMLMSVFERMREFGLLRALGWRRRRLVRMVVQEAVVLSLLGAVLGAGIGVGLAELLRLEPTIGKWLLPTYTGELFVRVTALVLMLGVCGSIYPALRAAAMPPAEALRYE